MNSLPLSVLPSASVSIGVFPIGQLRCTMKSADWHSSLLNVAPTANLWTEFINRLYLRHLVDEGTAIPRHTWHSNTGLLAPMIRQRRPLFWMMGISTGIFVTSLIVQILCLYHFMSSPSLWQSHYMVYGNPFSMRLVLGVAVWVIHGTPCEFLSLLALTDISSSLFSPFRPHMWPPILSSPHLTMPSPLYLTRGSWTPVFPSQR